MVASRPGGRDRRWVEERRPGREAVTGGPAGHPGALGRRCRRPATPAATCSDPDAEDALSRGACGVDAVDSRLGRRLTILTARGPELTVSESCDHRYAAPRAVRLSVEFGLPMRQLDSSRRTRPAPGALDAEGGWYATPRGWQRSRRGVRRSGSSVDGRGDRPGACDRPYASARSGWGAGPPNGLRANDAMPPIKVLVRPPARRRRRPAPAWARRRSSATTISHMRVSRASKDVIDAHLHLPRSGGRRPVAGSHRKMPDHQQRPARRDAGGEPGHHLADRAGDVDVEAADEVEASASVGAQRAESRTSTHWMHRGAQSGAPTASEPEDRALREVPPGRTTSSSRG